MGRGVYGAGPGRAYTPVLTMTILRAFLIIIAISFIAGLTLFGVLVRTDARIADRWIADWVADVLDRHLIPSVKFDDFSMDGRESITLSRVSLVSPEGDRVIEARSLRVAFAGIPLPGRPIQVRAIGLEGAVVRLIAERAPTSDGSANGRIVGLRGLAPLIEADAVRRPETVPADLRLRDTLRLERVELADATIEFDPSTGEPPMRLEGVSGSMVVSAADDGPGWRRVVVTIDGGPSLRAAASGAVSIGHRSARIESIRLDARVDEQTISSLPPSLQSAVGGIDLRGRATAAITGFLSLSQPEQNAIDLSATLAEFSIASGDLALPIDEAALAATLSGRTLDFSGRARLLGGALSLTDGSAVLEDGGGASAQWTASGLDLSRLMRAAGSKDGGLAGTLSTAGSVRVGAAGAPESLAGTGAFDVADGDLRLIPIVSALERAILDVAGDGRTGDRARADFFITPEGVRPQNLVIETELIAARGEGLIGWNGELDLTMNAGPLEKIQERTGAIGDLLALITDALVKYRVTGPASDPTIEPAPLGVE